MEPIDIKALKHVFELADEYIQATPNWDDITDDQYHAMTVVQNYLESNNEDKHASNMNINLFLDDVRDPKAIYGRYAEKDWTTVRTVDELWARLIELVYPADNIGHPFPGKIVVSLDHDLGENQHTGYEFIKRLEAAMDGDPTFRKLDIDLLVHSANPVGSENMRQGILSIYRLKRGISR